MSNKLDVSLLYKYRSDSLQSGASSATYSRKNSNASFAPGPAETYTIGDSVPLEEEGEVEAVPREVFSSGAVGCDRTGAALEGATGDTGVPLAERYVPHSSLCCGQCCVWCCLQQ